MYNKYDESFECFLCATEFKDDELVMILPCGSNKRQESKYNDTSMF